MGFWGSLFGGQNKTLDAGIKKSGQVADYSTGLGEKLTTQAGDWVSGLLSGDPTKQGQTLAPQIASAQQRAGQAKKTLAEFGTRGGGTGAAAANIDASTRGDINSMISQLTSGAAGTAASMGKGLLDTGMQALDKQVEYSQEQMQNWSNSILGMGLTTAASFAETYAMGKIPGGGAAKGGGGIGSAGANPGGE